MLNFSNVFNGPHVFAMLLLPCAFLLFSVFEKNKTSKVTLLIIAVISFVFCVGWRIEVVEYMKDPEIAIFSGEYVDTYMSGTGASSRSYYIFVNSEGEKKGFTKEGIKTANDNTYPIKGKWYTIAYAVDGPVSEIIINVEEIEPPENSKESSETE